MLPLKWVTIVPAHDGPLLLEFFGNGKLKSKKGNEMCWYRQHSLSLHNLFEFITRGWQPGAEINMVRNWRCDKKHWGGNMGESKINTATALQTNCIKDFCEYCGLDGARFHNAWMRKTYSPDSLRKAAHHAEPW